MTKKGIFLSSDTPVIELKNVKKSFGPVEVLKDINFAVRAGEVTALVGDNGADNPQNLALMLCIKI